MASDIGIRTGCDTQSEQRIFSEELRCHNCGSTDLTSYEKNGNKYFKCNSCGTIIKI